METQKKNHIFQKVGKTPIIPISAKLILVFICMILLSNLATNFITLRLTQGKVISLSNEIMVQQLKDIFSTATNQYSVSKFSGSTKDALKTIETVAKNGFTENNSIAFGVKSAAASNENLLFFACANEDFSLEKNPAISDLSIIEKLNQDMAENGKSEGSLRFSNYLGEYFGVYKYSEEWKCYIVRAELVKDTRKSLYHTYSVISVVILVLTIIFLVIGLVMFNIILKNVKTITDSLYQMQQNQKMDLIDLSKSPNDDISYLAASFNSLSFTINNLMEIFKKFASKDVVNKAYRDHYIELAGKQRELTILFSDIRGFTYMTETLGNEIINLLNIHYNRAIHQIHERDGIIGSIIGDAILAVYGTVDSRSKAVAGEEHGELVTGNKSLDALNSAWAITKVTAELRQIMTERYSEILEHKKLTSAEERVYKAIMLDVGVGIDGGTVFYGNIGSIERMTNTVIGDNVNSASRLEGLTRVYSLPVIVSEYVKNEVEQFSSQYIFYEIDIVQVKGKTEGKRIYLPLEADLTDEATKNAYEIFEQGLKAYYKGNWTEARKRFKESDVSPAKTFLERIGTKQAPADWSGIWTMTTK